MKIKSVRLGVLSNGFLQFFLNDRCFYVDMSSSIGIHFTLTVLKLHFKAIFPHKFLMGHIPSAASNSHSSSSNELILIVLV